MSSTDLKEESSLFRPLWPDNSKDKNIQLKEREISKKIWKVTSEKIVKKIKTKISKKMHRKKINQRINSKVFLN